MRNRTKKEQALIDDLAKFIVLLGAFAGWQITDTLTGAIIGFISGIVLLGIFAGWRENRFRKRMQRSGINEIDQMTGRQFEEYVGTLFESLGYKVIPTPVTGDYGADLVVKKDKEIIVVQAKRYKNTVGIKAVQEVIPAIKMYDATAAWVISNSTYTKPALTLAKRNDVRMIDRQELIKLSIEMKEKVA